MSLPSKSEVSAHFNQLGDRAQSSKQLRAHFRIEKKEKRDFKHLVRSLVDEGSLAKIPGRQYVLSQHADKLTKRYEASQASLAQKTQESRTVASSRRRKNRKAESNDSLQPGTTPRERPKFQAGQEVFKESSDQSRRSETPISLTDLSRDGSREQAQEASRKKFNRSDVREDGDRNVSRENRDTNNKRYPRDTSTSGYEGARRERNFRVNQNNRNNRNYRDSRDSGLLRAKVVLENDLLWLEIQKIEIQQATLGENYKLEQQKQLEPQKTIERYFLPEEDRAGAVPGDLVYIRPLSGVQYQGHPAAKVVAAIKAEEKFPDVVTHFYKSNHLYTSYPRSAIEEAESWPETEEINLESRRDLRTVKVITIDPIDAKDHDDALSLEKNGKGNWILGVHIADVSEYVGQDSAIDIEARKRCFTQYLPWTALPMLPERLAGGLCSLLEGHDRLSLSCMMEVSPQGELLDYEFVETVIRVDTFYSYQQAQKAKEEGDTFLNAISEMTARLSENRKKDGLLEFQFPEARAELNEEREPVRMYCDPRLDSHRWIEECMLLANQACARYMEENKIPGIYRVHEQPDLEEVYSLVTAYPQFMANDATPEIMREIHETRGFLNPALLKFYVLILSQRDEPLPPSLQRQVLRTMKKAQYSATCHGHFALGWKYYAHYTSPIRRYSDLWCHRMIKMNLHHKKPKPALKLLANEHAERISEREIEVMKVERRATRVAIAWVFRQYIGQEFVGDISGVETFGLFVHLEEPFGEGLIPLSGMHDDYYIFDESNGTLVGKRTRNRFSIGDKVKVMVERSDPFRGQVDFSLVETISASKSLAPKKTSVNLLSKEIKGSQGLRGSKGKFSSTNKKPRSRDKGKRRHKS